jgi:hypothetical protein
MLTLSQDIQDEQVSKSAPATQSPEKGREIAKTEARSRKSMKVRRENYQG